MFFLLMNLFPTDLHLHAIGQKMKYLQHNSNHFIYIIQESAGSSQELDNFAGAKFSY